MLSRNPRFGAGLALALAFPAAAADPLPAGDPSALGFSPDRLAALDAHLEERIGAGDFPGAVVMVARRGQVARLSALGDLREGGPEMTEDAIFRIYSMTKPVTSVVAMMLVEEGRLSLSDPISAYLPEYAEMTVLPDDAEAPVPAARPIRVHDLLLHTAGMTYGFFGAGPAREALKAENLERAGLDNREIARRIAALPLEHQPGEVWEHSRSPDVLGALIEVVEGKSLGEVFEAWVFGPLGMTDTGFLVEDEAARPRLAEANADDMAVGAAGEMFDPAAPRSFESGGGGLVFTVHDCARFSQMLLNGGEFDSVRLLSPKTVACMTADHMEGRGRGKYWLMAPGYGFGLGFGVRLETGQAPAMGSVGGYCWGGAAGTYVWWDPAEEMFVVYMMQSPRHRVPLRATLRNMVYGAMTEAAVPGG